MVQAFEVNFDGYSTEFGKSLDYLHYLCFTFSSTLAKQSSPLLLSENELMSLRFDVNNDVLGLKDLKLPFFIFWSLRNIISKNFIIFQSQNLPKLKFTVSKAINLAIFETWE